MLASFCSKTPRDEGAVFLAPSADILGDVVLGPGSSVWYHAVLRGDAGSIRVGADTNIQDGAVLHCDEGGQVLLGSGVTVGHCALVHGCQVGDDTLIGMHATLLNGCRVGRGCIIGAGALVTEGTVIPDGMVAVGVPARVLKPVTPQQQQANRENAQLYVRHGQQHAAALAHTPTTPQKEG